MTHPTVPDDLVDIITQDILKDPVTAEDGHVYSRESISDWIETCQLGDIPILSPFTRLEMGSKLVDNLEIQRLLKQFHATVKECQSQEASTPCKFQSPTKDIPSGTEKEAFDQPMWPPSLKNMSSLFRMLDHTPSFTAEILPNWIPPCITVIGNESSGKSTILERLLMMSIFPRGQDICTRVPIKVELRYSIVSKTPTLDVVDTSGELIKSFPLPSLDHAYIDIMSTMTAIIQEQCGHAVGICVDRMIVVHVSSPFVPSMDIVDLPGIVATSSRVSVAADVPVKTRQLVEEYIQAHPESLYLAVLEAGSRFSCAACLEFVQAHGLQSNTIGVVTKCDLISTKALKELRRCVVDQDVSVGGIVLQPHGYVCTMHDAGTDDEKEGEETDGDTEYDSYDEEGSRENNGEGVLKTSSSTTSSVIKKKKLTEQPATTNYSRLIRQDGLETEWFGSASVQYLDMINSGHAGSRSIVSKIDNMYIKQAKNGLIPKVLFDLQSQRDDLQKRNVALGMPAPPPTATSTTSEAPPVLSLLPSEYQQLKSEMCQHIQALILESAVVIRKAYAMDVLEPLLSCVLATSTGTIVFTDCLNPLNSVEKWLHSLQNNIRAICVNSVEHAKNFWCEFIERILVQDSSSFQMARFRKVISHIKESMKQTLELSLNNLLEDMDQSIGQFLETINLVQGVSVRYDFMGHEKVTLCWESEALGHSLVYHLTCEEVLLTPTRLADMIISAVEAIEQCDLFQEQCSDTRAVLMKDIQALEHQYQHILTTLIAHKNDSEASLSTLTESTDIDNNTNSAANGKHYCCQLKSAGLSPQVLLKHHFSIETLRHGSFTVADLLAIGVPHTKLFKAGYSVQELRRCELNLSVLIGQAVAEHITVSALVMAGFTYRDLDDFGYDFVLMLGVGCKNIPTAHVLQALLVLPLSAEEHEELLNRGILGSLLTLWLSLFRDNTDDVGGKRLDPAEERDQAIIKEDILKVLCKFYPGACDTATGTTASDAAATTNVLNQQHIESIVNTISDPDGIPTLKYSALKTLRLYSSECPVTINLLMQTHILDSVLLAILDKKGSGSIPSKLEALVLLRNIAVYYSEQLLSKGYVPLLLKNIISDSSSNQHETLIDTTTATPQHLAALLLYMLASTPDGMQVVLKEQELQSRENQSALTNLLSSVIASAKSLSETCVLMILKGIENLSRQVGADIKAFWMSDNTITSFYVEKLNNHLNLALLTSALSIVYDLCSTGSAHREVFALRMFIIKPLTKLLSITTHEVNIQAIKILVLFVEDSSMHKLTIAKEGGIPLLLLMLHADCSLESKLHATSLLIPLAAETSNSLAIVQGGAVDLLIDMLFEDSDRIKEAAAATMRSLAYIDENRIIIANDGGIDPLLCILQAPTVAPTCKIMATRTLRNLAFNCTDNKMAIANLGGISHLVDMLQSNHVTGDMGVIVAAGVLQNLCYKIPENVRLLIEADALPLLAEILLHGSNSAREASAGVIRNVANDGQHCQAVFQSGVLEALIWMFKHEQGSCHTAARDALRTIAQNDFCRTNMKQAGITKKDINYKKTNW